MNPEINQDRVFDLFELYNKSQQIMFHQQRSIYWHLIEEVRGRMVLEAGCGTGQGTALLSRSAYQITGTDKLERNVNFAKCLYPWISFDVWDLNYPYPARVPVVVCVEAVEHVRDTKAAIANLLTCTQEDLWISTPNGRGKPMPPDNPYHVWEYTPQEMLDLLSSHKVMIHRWDNWKAVDPDTDCDPLVYHVRKQ